MQLGFWPGLAGSTRRVRRVFDFLYFLINSARFQPRVSRVLDWPTMSSWVLKLWYMQFIYFTKICFPIGVLKIELAFWFQKWFDDIFYIPLVEWHMNQATSSFRWLNSKPKCMNRKWTITLTQWLLNKVF